MALAGRLRATQILRIFQFSKVSLNFLTERSTKNVTSSISHILQNKYFSTNEKTEKIPARSAKRGSTSEQAVKKKKPLVSPQITLILPENNLSSMTLENAQKLADRRNLKLVKILDYDTKSEKPLFKLMTTLEFFDEGVKMKERKKKEKNSSLKEEKLFTISTKISDHDLDSKLRQMEKLLKKKHELKVYISVDGNPTKAEEVAGTIETELSESISKTRRGSTNFTLKLFITPKVEVINNSPVSDVSEDSIKETDKKVKETDKYVKEVDKKVKESVKNVVETNKKVEEVKEADKNIKATKENKGSEKKVKTKVK